MRLFSFILVVLIVFTWALLAALAVLITLITNIPSLVKDKQTKKRAKEIIQHGGPQSREQY